MQCVNCGFENMPGVQACVRCGAPLQVAQAKAADFMPPRAGRWKFLRPLKYLHNRILNSAPSLPPGLVLPFINFNGTDLLAALLSVVPGLGHLLVRRWRAAGIAILVWFLLAAATVWYCLGTPGWILAGLLMSWHAMVIMDAGRVGQNVADHAWRVGIAFLIIVFLTFGYYSIPRPLMLACPWPVPALKINANDILWGWRRQTTAELSRDALVFVEVNARGLGMGFGGVYLTVPAGPAIGCLAGLPGDELVFTPAGIRLNGVLLPLANLPGREQLLLPVAGEIAVKVPEDHFLVVLPLEVGRIRRGFAGDDICRILYNSMFVVERSRFIGRPAGVYLPIRNRRLF